MTDTNASWDDMNRDLFEGSIRRCADRMMLGIWPAPAGTATHAVDPEESDGA